MILHAHSHAMDSIYRLIRKNKIVIVLQIKNVVETLPSKQMYKLHHDRQKIAYY